MNDNSNQHYYKSSVTINVWLLSGGIGGNPINDKSDIPKFTIVLRPDGGKYPNSTEIDTDSSFPPPSARYLEGERFGNSGD